MIFNVNINSVSQQIVSYFKSPSDFLSTVNENDKQYGNERENYANKCVIKNEDMVPN